MAVILSIFTFWCISTYFVVYSLKLILFDNWVVYYYSRIFLIFLLHPVHVYLNTKIQTHRHTHTHIYLCLYVCVFVPVAVSVCIMSTCFNVLSLGLREVHLKWTVTWSACLGGFFAIFMFFGAVFQISSDIIFFFFFFFFADDALRSELSENFKNNKQHKSNIFVIWFLFIYIYIYIYVCVCVCVCVCV